MREDPKKIKERLLSWIKEYFAEQGPSSAAVIGISGGKDSSICAALLCEALGPERVYGVLLPNGEQSDLADAKEVARILGMPSFEMNIAPAYEGMKRALSPCPPSNDALINLAPRLRMAALYSVAQSLPCPARVCNTSNRSEIYLGYSTKFGDSAGDFALLSSFFVSEVLDIGRLTPLPAYLIEKTPSDGLSGMSDEEKLGVRYEEVERFLNGEEIDEKSKEKILRLHRVSAHKRSPMPSFSLD